MNKNGTRGLITLSILFIVFSVITFALPLDKSTTFWMGYIFGIVAICFQVYVLKVSFIEEGNAKSRFYGMPILRVGIVYLVIQLILSLIEIIGGWFIPFWISLIVNIILLAGAIIGCVTAEATRDEIVLQDEKLKRDVSNMRDLQSLSASFIEQCDDEDIKPRLIKIAEDFKFSDPVSSDATKVLEEDLKIQLIELHNAILEKDLNVVHDITKIEANLRERNRICSLNKGVT